MKTRTFAVAAMAVILTLFGAATRARADAITVGSVSQMGGKITGSGTFAVDANKTLVGTIMIVKDSTNHQVSGTPGINVTTAWSSITAVLPAGNYTVSATLITKDAGGTEYMTPSMNSMPITIP